MAAGNEEVGGGISVAEAGVTLVEAGVKEAELLTAEGGGLALQAVGLDVAAEGVLHGGKGLLTDWGGPPGSMGKIAEINAIDLEVPLKSSFDWAYG